MEKGVKVVSEVYVQQHDAGHAHMAPETQQSDDLPVLLHQIKELQDRLRLESLHKLRLQKIVMSKSQEATAAAHWAASVQEECTLLNQRLDALEAELGSDAKAALRMHVATTTDVICDQGNRQEASTQTPTGEGNNDFFQHIVEELETAKQERTHYEHQALSLSETITQLKHQLEVNGIEAPPCTPIAPRDEVPNLAPPHINSPRAIGHTWWLSNQVHKEHGLSMVQPTCSTSSSSSMGMDDTAIASSSPVKHDRAVSQIVVSNTSPRSIASLRASLRRRSRSLHERGHHARLSCEMVESKLKELEANVNQVRNELGEERGHRSAMALHNEVLEEMQRKLAAVEAMVSSKDAQVTMLQETLRHAEDNFNAALHRVQELEQELCGRYPMSSVAHSESYDEAVSEHDPWARSKSMPFLRTAEMHNTEPERPASAPDPRTARRTLLTTSASDCLDSRDPHHLKAALKQTLGSQSSIKAASRHGDLTTRHLSADSQGFGRACSSASQDSESEYLPFEAAVMPPAKSRRSSCSIIEWHRKLLCSSKLPNV